MRFAGVLVLLVTAASMITSSLAKQTNCLRQNGSSSSSSGSWSWSFSYCGSGSDQPSPQQRSKKMVVGGDRKWSTNNGPLYYQMWADQNQPFFVNDTLVFKYDRSHTVYLMQLQDMLSCDFSRAGADQLIGNNTAGGGDGFEYVLKAKTWWEDPSYHFACGKYCKAGMKFSVFPMFFGQN